MIKCEICGKEFMSLASHLQWEHDKDSHRYLLEHPGAPLVDPQLVATRARNRDSKAARSKMMATFAARYEGGHPMRTREGVEAHKAARAANGNRYNLESTKATNKAKHGVEFLAQLPERREASSRLMRALNEGRASVCPDSEEFKRLLLSGVPVYELSRRYGFSSNHAVHRWIKEMGLQVPSKRHHTQAVHAAQESTRESRGVLTDSQRQEAIGILQGLFAKKGATPSKLSWGLSDGTSGFPGHVLEYSFGSWGAFVSSAGLPMARGPSSLRDTVEGYLRSCHSAGKVLSAYEYGEACGGAGDGEPGNKMKQRVNRIFSISRGSHKELVDELPEAILSEESINVFLSRNFHEGK